MWLLSTMRLCGVQAKLQVIISQARSGKKTSPFRAYPSCISHHPEGPLLLDVQGLYVHHQVHRAAFEMHSMRCRTAQCW